MSLMVDLKFLQEGRQPKQTNFGTKLFELIIKADLHNRTLLKKSFPNAVETFEYWAKTKEYLDKEYD